jgi:hypothetical protein
VAAVVLNVTVTGAGGPGYVTLFPAGSPRPTSSSINYKAWDTVANLVQAPVGTGGNASIFVGGAAVHVIADVVGYYLSDLSSGNGLYHPLTPARIADSRWGSGLAVPPGPNQSEDLQVTGRGGVPATGVSGVILNLTATSPTTAGWVSVSPSGGSLAGTSNLNFTAGQTIANRVVTGVGADGKVTVHNGAGTVQVIVDVVGWFSDASAPAGTTGRYLGLLPTRVLDTRLGTGGVGTLNPGQTLVTIAGVGGIPPGGAAAVIMNLTATNGIGPGFVSLYPSDVAFPNTSDINFSAGDSRANHAVSRLGADGKVALYNATGLVDAIIDVQGYYSN